MEGASGDNKPSTLRRGTNQSKDVPHATAWSRQIRHCSPRRGVDEPMGYSSPHRGMELINIDYFHATTYGVVGACGQKCFVHQSDKYLVDVQQTMIY